MKKSKIWIHVCVHLLLFITLGVHSSKFVNPVTDDISTLSVLRQNIPKDYNISLDYIPKEEAGMCWVTLNVYPLEKSLETLADKFGNISSNKKDIKIFIQILQEIRLKITSLNDIMMEFECHYRQERWKTEQYFEFVKDFFIAVRNSSSEYSDDCDPPPCPTTPYIATTGPTSTTTTTTNAPTCQTDCSPHTQPRLISKVVEQSLFSLLFIPLLALVFLLVWKVRSRRNEQDQQNSGEDGLFTATEGTAPPLDAEISEKNKLNDTETV